MGLKRMTLFLGASTVLSRREICASLLSLVMICGCSSNQQTKALSKPTKPATWPELAALQTPEVGMPILLNAQRGDTAGLKKAATDEKFKGLVDQLVASKIPSEFASPARAAAKTKLEEAYKKLIELASGSGSPKDLKDAALAVQSAIGDVANPDLK
jgi:hypothetical protein